MIQKHEVNQHEQGLWKTNLPDSKPEVSHCKAFCNYVQAAPDDTVSLESMYPLEHGGSKGTFQRPFPKSLPVPGFITLDHHRLQSNEVKDGNKNKKSLWLLLNAGFG